LHSHNALCPPQKNLAYFKVLKTEKEIAQLQDTQYDAEDKV